MAAAEPYDYLSIVSPDYNYTLTIDAQGTVTEEGYKNQVVHLADDNTRKVITIGTSSSRFFVSWDWNILTEAESGTVFDLYHDPNKAYGVAYSFKWEGHDGHDYVVCFCDKLIRKGGRVSAWGIPKLRLEILGKVS